MGSFDGRRHNAAGKNLNTRRMEIKRHLWPAARAATIAAAVACGSAALWDACRLARIAVWPPVSYVLLALAVAAASAGVLLRVLTSRRAPVRNAFELAVTGLVLLAWWLRGHPGIPADPPLVVAQALAALLLAASARRDRGPARPRH